MSEFIFPSARGYAASPLEPMFAVRLLLGSAMPCCATRWFPYEVYREDFVFIVDNDASIFVSIENLPDSVRSRALQLLRELADKLYGAQS